MPDEPVYEKKPWLERCNKSVWREDFDAFENYTGSYFGSKHEFCADFCEKCGSYGAPDGCNNEDGTCRSFNVAEQLFDRLWFYEQTGLTPRDLLEITKNNGFLTGIVSRLKAEIDGLKYELFEADINAANVGIDGYSDDRETDGYVADDIDI